MRKYKTKLDPKVKKIIDMLGIDLRIGPSPEAVGLEVSDPKFNEVAAYFGNGVIYVNSSTKYDSKELNFVFLHEIGHAIVLHYLGNRINTRYHEIKANAVALALSMLLNFKVSDRMLNNCVIYTKTKKRKKFSTVDVRRLR